MAQKEDETRVLIVIDGPNVGMSHSANKWPASAKGIAASVLHYANLGYDVHAFVPRHFLNDNAGKRGVDNPSIIRKLRDDGLVASVPSQDHDDDYWLQFAWQKDAYVVTNDRMKDHVEKYPGDDEEAFFKWRDKRVISYTFVGDDFFANPTFELPEPPKNVKGDAGKNKLETNDKSNKTSVPVKKKKGKISEAKSNNKFSSKRCRFVFREVVRNRLSKGPVNCGMLASEITKLVGNKLSHDFSNRKALMEAMNIRKNRPFHEQLKELMGNELDVELVNGQPINVRLTKNRKQKTRIPLNKFKNALGENDLDKLRVSAHELPKIVADSLPFFAELEYPANYAEVGHRFKDKYDKKINAVFTNMDNLVKFMNFRFEIPYDDIVRDDFMITRSNKASKSEKLMREKKGILKRIFSMIFGD
ncbi:MAG: hypothetical protein CMA77_00570 [Euryarchaeota archaeon]|nr:hypothetical protein [Euryarchaeota archaeon]